MKSNFNPKPGVAFKTPVGWCGISRTVEGIDRVIIGARSRSGIISLLGKGARIKPGDTLLAKTQRRIKEYLSGQEVLFDLPLDLHELTAWQRRVLTAARRIPYGRTRTYGWLAEKVGRPEAARAVGNTMAANPVPLIIPCHRVIRNDGTLGGFSATGGIRLKATLLQLEAEGSSTHRRRTDYFVDTLQLFL